MRRFSRSNFLRLSGTVGAALFGGSLLAACQPSKTAAIIGPEGEPTPIAPTPKPESEFNGVKIVQRPDGVYIASTDENDANSGDFVNAAAAYFQRNPNDETRNTLSDELQKRHPECFETRRNETFQNWTVDYRLPQVAIPLEPDWLLMLVDQKNQNP